MTMEDMTSASDIVGILLALPTPGAGRTIRENPRRIGVLGRVQLNEALLDWSWFKYWSE